MALKILKTDYLQIKEQQETLNLKAED